MSRRGGEGADAGEAAGAAGLGPPLGVHAVSDHYDLVFEGVLKSTLGVGLAVPFVVGGLSGQVPVITALFMVGLGGFYTYMSYGVLKLGWDARRAEVHVFEQGLVVARRGRVRAFRWDDVTFDTYYNNETRTRVWRLTRTDGKRFALYTPVDGVTPGVALPLRQAIRDRLWSREQRRATAVGYLYSTNTVVRHVTDAVRRCRSARLQLGGLFGSSPRPATAQPGAATPSDEGPPARRWPRSVGVALVLMGLGAGLALVRVLVLLGGRGRLAKDQPTWTGEQVSSVHITAVTLAIVVVGLWVWMIIKNAQGRPWARWVSGALALLNGVTAIIRIRGGWTFAQNELAAVPPGEVAVLLQIIDLADVMVGLLIMSFLLQQDSGDHYRTADHRHTRLRMQKSAQRDPRVDHVRRPWSVLVAALLLGTAAVVAVVSTFLGTSVAAAVPLAGLWAWIAVKSAQGRLWARGTATILVVLDLLIRSRNELFGRSGLAASGAAGVVDAAYVALSAVAVALLYLPGASRFFRATTHTLARDRLRRYEPDDHTTHRQEEDRPVAGPIRRRLRSLFSHLDARLDAMSQQAACLSILGMTAALLLAVSPIGLLVPVLGRLALVLAGLMLGAMTALPFSRILAKQGRDPTSIPAVHGWRVPVLTAIYMATATGIFVGGINVVQLIEPPDPVWTFTMGFVFGAALILWFAAIIVLKVQEPPRPRPLPHQHHLTDWRDG